MSGWLLPALPGIPALTPKNAGITIHMPAF